MWPYTIDEWEHLTHGNKKVAKKSNDIIWMSVLPSAMLIGSLVYLLLS